MVATTYLDWAKAEGIDDTMAAAAAHSSGQDHDRIPNTPISLPRPVDSDISIASKMLSAVTGSVLTSLLVTPLDVVRVRLQSQPSPSPSSTLASRLPSFVHLPPNLGVTACCREVFWVSNNSQFCVAAPAHLSADLLEPSRAGAVVSDCAAETTQSRTINSTLDGLRKISRNEGILTLWRGLSPTLAMAIPANVIYFAGYDWLRSSPSSPLVHRIPDAYLPLAGGSLARVLAAVAVSPLEMLRTRMQATSATSATSGASTGVLRATVGGLRQMVSNEGYTSLWRGLSLTLWRDVPFSALYWWGYEYGRARLDASRSRTRGTELSHSALLTDSFLAGAGSGAIAAFVTTPFDVGKTRQQTGRGASTTMVRAMWGIYCSEGTKGLFKGWAARCLKVAPACAIMISSYEVGKKMAGEASATRREGLDR